MGHFNVYIQFASQSVYKSLFYVLLNDGITCFLQSIVLNVRYTVEVSINMNYSYIISTNLETKPQDFQNTWKTLARTNRQKQRERESLPLNTLLKCQFIYALLKFQHLIYLDYATWIDAMEKIHKMLCSSYR